MRNADKLQAVAKFPALSGSQLGLSRMGKWVPSWLSRTRLIKYIPGGPRHLWIDRKLARPSCELSVLWVDDLPFEYLNQDYPGRSVVELIELADDFLGSPFMGEPLSRGSLDLFASRLVHGIEDAPKVVVSSIDHLDSWVAGQEFHGTTRRRLQASDRSSSTSGFSWSPSQDLR
jgi:hypothetical protein